VDLQLHKRMKLYIEEDTSFHPGNDDIIQTELLLTGHFFEYAQFAYAGKIDPSELQWHIPRKKLDAMALLDSLIANKGQNLEEWEPVNPQYRLMKKQLAYYDSVDKAGDLREIRLGAREIYG
jgi:hypothetical protein